MHLANGICTKWRACCGSMKGKPGGLVGSYATEHALAFSVLHYDAPASCMANPTLQAPPALCMCVFSASSKQRRKGAVTAAARRSAAQVLPQTGQQPLSPRPLNLELS
jgi:hypothetical protein